MASLRNGDGLLVRRNWSARDCIPAHSSAALIAEPHARIVDGTARCADLAEGSRAATAKAGSRGILGATVRTEHSVGRPYSGKVWVVIRGIRGVRRGPPVVPRKGLEPLQGCPH